LNRGGHLPGDGVGFGRIENLFAHGLVLLQEKRLPSPGSDDPAAVELGRAAK